MSQALPIATNPPANRAASRRAFIHAIVTAAVLGAGVLAVRGLEAALHATFDKPPAPLQKNLDQLSKTLGTPPRYDAFGSDLVLDPDTVQTLGTKDYLIRQYRDRSVPDSAGGGLLNVNINYYGTGDSTPHVPENCWVGNGREQDGGSEIFDVTGVRRHDGSIVTLRVKLVSFKPPAVDLEMAGNPAGTTPDGQPLLNNVAYVFHVNGEYVANTREVTSRFWKATNRYAYHAKIEVTPMTRLSSGRGEAAVRPLLCTREQAKAITADFLRASLSEIEACLPDPAILTAAPNPTGSAIPNEVK